MRKTFIHSILAVILLIMYAQSWGAPESANEHRTYDPMVLEETGETDKRLAVSTGDNAGIDLTNEGNIGFATPPVNAELQLAKVIIRDYGVVFPDGKYQTEAWRNSLNGIFYEAGNVGIGIGTYGPEAKLHVEAGAGEGLRVTSSNGNSHFPYNDGWSYISGKGIIFRSNGDNEGMRLDSSGNVGIGTTSPSSKLHVEAGAGEGLRVMSSNGNSHFPLHNGWSYISGKGIIFRSNGNNERMRLVSDGTLIIGGTSKLHTHSSFKLQVYESAYFGGGVSALGFVDRTPYPKDLETAYAAVLSMERLPPEEYDENDKENQLDHSKLHGFVKSQDGMYRDLSATVSAQNEVIKDLLKRIEELEAKAK